MILSKFWKYSMKGYSQSPKGELKLQQGNTNML